MKRVLLISLLAVMFGSALCANAQAGSFITANVPFEFYVGETRMPAGEYRVQMYGTNDMLQITSRDTGDVLAVLSVNSSRSRGDVAPQLTFRNYGRSYFLAEVTLPHSVNKVPQAKTEREFAARLSGQPEVATVSGTAR